MIVADASVVVTALLDSGPDGEVARHVLTADEVHAPHLLDVEVTSAIRRWLRSGRLLPVDARAYVRDLTDLAITRHGHETVLERVLELRDSMTAYDGTYVALGELLGATVVTADARLARAPGPRCTIRLLPPSPPG